MRWLFWSSGSQRQMSNNENNTDKITPAVGETNPSSSVPCANCSTPIITPPTDTSNPLNPPHQTRRSPARDWNASLAARDWAGDFKDPRNLIPTLLLTSGILFCVRIHRKYLRRIPIATSISPTYFHKRSIFGRVTSVGDGDNFRLFHTPGGRLAGWEWLPFRKVPTAKKELKDRTIRSCLSALRAVLPYHPHPSRRHRRPRTPSLRPPRPTLRPCSPHLANKLPPQPARARLRLPAGPIRPRRRHRIRAPVAVPFHPARCGLADAARGAGDGVRGEERGGVWRRGDEGEVSAGGGEGEEAEDWLL
ncbi:hypothetical protein ACJ73_07205 [Blastomyces percursus]|uniref:Uncharacterized protein n=1 Tax=Blastomyces percursus TaxID=1658174 RepID=A0A1J9PYR2_9EURO|nr:hypothetical protein ACJ73_07205 [Blastomyces percursus]